MLWTKSWHLMQSCPSLMWKQASGGTHPWVLGNISGDDSQCWLADGGSSGTSIVLWRHLLPFNLSYFSLWHHLTFCSSCTSGTSCWSRFFQVVLQALEFSFGEEFLGCGYCLSAVLKTICIHSASIYCWEEFDQRRSPNLSWCLFCLLCFYLKCLLKLFWSCLRLTLPRPVLLDPCDWKHKFLVLAFISLTDFSEHFFFIKVSLIMERVWLFFWQFRIDVN